MHKNIVQFSTELG